MDLVTIRERMLATPLFKRLPETMHQRLAQALLWIAQTEDVSREQRLFELGQKNDDEGVIVLEGMVRIITEQDRNKTIEAPDVLGEIQLFTPERTRTATVEVVVGGTILRFQWRDLARELKAVLSGEEMETLRKAIVDSAWQREQFLAERLGLSSDSPA